MPPSNVPTRLPTDLPALQVTPGPTRATPLPDDRPVRWGILATGRIAHAFAAALALLPDAELAAVGSRRQATADEFAAAYGIGRAHGTYADLVADPEVDVVYVASPHALHREHVLMALEAGKPVLCEKPLTLTVDEAGVLVAEARRRGLFLMEAMWMRCHPVIRRLRQLVSSGALGQVRQVRADLGWQVDAPPTDRLLDPSLGGGALLDLGVYTLTFAQLFLGEPDRVVATAGLSEQGVDLDVAVSLGYPTGAVASLTSSMSGPTPRTASITTDRGRFDLAESFHHPREATWTSEDHVETVTEPVLGTGLPHEAAEVMRCLRTGETESPLVPLDETLAVLRLMDRIRDQIGVTYAADDFGSSG